MTDMGMDHPIVARISALRQRVRAFLALYGLGVALSFAFGAALVLGLADYWLRISPMPRVVLLITALVALAVLVWRFLVAPLSTRLTDQFLASRVETVHPKLADELISAVYFVRQGTAGQNALAAKAIEAVEREAAGVRFEDALDFRPAGKVLAIAGGLLAVIVILAAAAPSLAGIAFQRWFAPMSGAHWPQATEVEFVWEGGKPPAAHPLGDPLVVRAAVTKGYHKDMRVFLYAYEHRELMNYQAPLSSNTSFVYEKQLEPVGESISLRLVAGDDNEQLPITIPLRKRPTVSSITAQIVPPPYVKNPADPSKPAAIKTADLTAEVGRAVEGSTVHLLIKSSNAFNTVNGQPDVTLMEPNRDVPVPLMNLQRKLVQPDVAEITFVARQPLEFRTILRDANRFENRVVTTSRLEVVPDAMPTVVITEPRRQVECVAGAVVDVKVQSTDDLGLGEILLQADAFDAKPGDKPRFQQALTWENQQVEASGAAVTGLAGLRWDLAALNLKEGDRLSFYAMVRDNFEVPAKDFAGPAGENFEKASGEMIRHRMVKSAAYTLAILSKEQIEEKYRKELQDVREQIRNLNKQQETTNTQTKAIQKTAAEAGVTTQQQRAQLADLASQQANQAARAMAIQQRTEQIKAGLQTNKMENSDLSKMANETSEGMKDVGQKNMPQAADQLNKAQDAAGKGAEAKSQSSQAKDAAKSTAEAAGKAGEQQQQAMNTMNKLVDRLADAGDFAKIREDVNKALDKQKQLEKDLQKTAASTVGKKPSDLTPEEKKALDQIAKEQAKLGQDVQKLTENAEKTGEQLSKSDPASSEALKQAAESSRSNQISSSMSQASSSASQNQTTNAANSQQQARRGLEDMKDKLDQQNRRQLEQLARQLEELLEAVKKLRAAQAAINDETGKAGDKAKDNLLKPLGDRQMRLQGNTLSETSRAEAVPSGRAAAGDLRDAADSMGSATTALLKTMQPMAVQPEEDALVSLDAAIKKLQKEKEKVDKQLKDEDLASIGQKYMKIKEAQEKLKAEGEAIHQRKEKRGDLLRPDLLKLAEETVAQGKLSEDVQDLSTNKELSQYEVVVWINQQIQEAMGDAKGLLSKAQTGKELASRQQSAIDRLQDIIDAIKEERAKKDDFAQGGGGGGGGGGGKPPLIPPAAQLKLLKSQQVIVNRETVATHTDIEAAKSEADKGQLRQQADKLGQRQDKIKDLATKVVEKLKR